MKKLVLVALCSTSLLSVARAEGGGNMGSGSSMQQQDAMKAGDAAGHAGSMSPDSTPAHAEAKKAKKQAKKHDGMGHGSMQHDGMGHGSMQHDGQMDGGTK